jgi:hypothetical protein
MTEPIAFFDPHKGFYWAKPTKINAPVTVDVEPLALYEQSTWVGLTDDELFDCWESAMNGNVYTKIRVYSAIEAKLKEKNNG